MTFDQQILLKGIQLLLGTQLIVVAILHLVMKSIDSKKWLAILCLIHGLWFFKHVFYGYWTNNLFLFILIGPGKPIFVGTILLFYLRSFSGRSGIKNLLIHLLMPTIYYLILIVSRLYLRQEIVGVSSLQLSIGFSICTFIIFWYYFIVSKTEIKNRVRNVLIPRAFKRLNILFFSLYFFLLQIPIWDILEKINGSNLVSAGFQSVLDVFYTGFFRFAGYYSSYLYIHVLGYFIFFYALSELPYLKKLFLPKETTLKKPSQEMRERWEKFFLKEKAFISPDLNAHACSKKLGVSKSEFFGYLRSENKPSFKDFLNELRVEEFKKVMVSGDNVKYDLFGIASQCGFKSKATFFRVFKSLEGMTPKEFKDLKLGLDKNRLS